MSKKDCTDETVHHVYLLVNEGEETCFESIASEESVEKAREKANELAQDKDIPTSSLIVAPQDAKPFPSLPKAIRLVKKHQRSYVEDFYWHDINKFLKHATCVWGIRPSGTVLLPLDSTEPLSEKAKVFQLEYASYYLDNIEHNWYIWSHDTIRKISQEEAKRRVYAFLK
ncbi:hypothetical protein [Rossellomorea marisflavi]|uniref:hypothetical protein n=1 Tax=Rossellomorea marisflavi TaxID=189381 RepID=UPI003F9FBC89